MAAAMVGDEFKVCIEKIFNSWSVLQLAIHQGFGGQHTSEKARWFVDVTVQWFKDNKNLDPYEVEDFVTEILNNEFDTIADDGSLSFVACSICKCYSLTEQGKISEVEAFLSKLPKPNPGQCVRSETRDSAEESSEGESDSQEVKTEDMDTSEPSQHSAEAAGNTETENSMEAGNEDNEADDEWTVVRRGKKR